MFELKPDFEEVRQRYEAWWDCAIVDRPLVSIYYPRPEEQQGRITKPKPSSLKASWLDVEYQVERACAEVSNLVYYADALPVRYPNLGPSIFSTFYGCELEYGEETTWSRPILKSWNPDEVGAVRLDTENFFFKKTLELTKAMAEAARGRFIVGYTDLHPGGDAIADFRHSQDLCVDVLFHAAEIRSLCDRIIEDFFHVYELYHDTLAGYGMPSTSWLPAVCSGRFHIPSNDFSCMISAELFEDLFLPGIERECAYMDRSIYHLDGPNALRYLDRIMDIPKLHAVQWVPGAGREHWRQWVDVYRRIQQRGKAFTVYVPAAEVEEFTALLRPEGAWPTVYVKDRQEADAVLNLIRRWGTSHA